MSTQETTMDLAPDTDTDVAADMTAAATAASDKAPLPGEHVEASDTPEYGDVDPQAQRSSLLQAAQNLIGKAANPDPDLPDDSDDDGETDAPTPPAPVKTVSQRSKAPASDDVAKARAAIQRVLGKDMADKVLAGVSDREIIDRGKVLAKQQDDQQRAFDESRLTQERIEQLVEERIAARLTSQQQQAPAPAPGMGQQAQTPAPAGVNQQAPSAIAKAVEQTLDQVFEQSEAWIDDDIKGPLKAAMSQVAVTLESDFQKRLEVIEQQRQQDLNQMYLQRERLEMREIALSDDFRKEHPEVAKNRELFDVVVDAAYRIAQTDPDRKEYFDQAGNPRFDRLMSAAATLVTHKKNPTKQAQVAIARSQRRVADAQPVSGSRQANTGPVASTPTDPDSVRAAMLAKLSEMQRNG